MASKQPEAPKTFEEREAIVQAAMQAQGVSVRAKPMRGPLMFSGVMIPDVEFVDVRTDNPTEG